MSSSSDSSSSAYEWKKTMTVHWDLFSGKWKLAVSEDWTQGLVWRSQTPRTPRAARSGLASPDYSGPRARTATALTRVATNRWSPALAILYIYIVYIYLCRYWTLQSHTDKVSFHLNAVSLATSLAASCRKCIPLCGAGSRRQNTSPSSELDQSNVEKPGSWFALFDQGSKVFAAFFVLEWNLWTLDQHIDDVITSWLYIAPPSQAAVGVHCVDMWCRVRWCSRACETKPHEPKQEILYTEIRIVVS